MFTGSLSQVEPESVPFCLNSMSHATEQLRFLHNREFSQFLSAMYSNTLLSYVVLSTS